MTRRRLAYGLAVAAGMWAAGMAAAAEPGPPAPAAGLMLCRGAAHLDLTEQQQAQLKQLRQDMREQMQALRHDSGRPDPEAVQQLRAKHREAVEQLLTEAQLAQLTAMCAAAGGPMGCGLADRGMPPPGPWFGAAGPGGWGSGPEGRPWARPGLRSHGDRAQRWQDPLARLDLTDQQRAELKKLRQQQQEQLRQLRAEHRADSEKLQRQQRQQVEGLLTKEQRQQLEQLKDDAFYSRRGPGGPPEPEMGPEPGEGED